MFTKWHKYWWKKYRYNYFHRLKTLSDACRERTSNVFYCDTMTGIKYLKFLLHWRHAAKLYPGNYTRMIFIMKSANNWWSLIVFTHLSMRAIGHILMLGHWNSKMLNNFYLIVSNRTNWISAWNSLTNWTVKNLQQWMFCLALFLVWQEMLPHSEDRGHLT